MLDTQILPTFAETNYFLFRINLIIMQNQDREQNYKICSKWLTFLQLEVKNDNYLNLQNINVHSENLFRDLFNLVYDTYKYKLRNSNYKSQNASAIDLFDDEQKLVIQVTSDNSGKKVHETIEKFNKGQLYNDYGRLIVFVIGDKQEFPKTTFAKLGTGTLFDKKDDIKDIKDLLRDIQDLHSDKLQEVATFIYNHIALKVPQQRRKEANEVETIMSLIEYISNNESLGNEIEQEPDPEKKMKRFSEHEKYLRSRYIELFSANNNALEEAKNNLGIDGVKAKKIQSYLKKVSNNHLTEKKGDAKSAIDGLISFFEIKIQSTEYNFDEGAIEFYLIDELIRCNVFPNPN